VQKLDSRGGYQLDWFSKFKAKEVIKDIRDKYEIGQQIGEGSFGSVYLAKHKDFQREFAIKRISKESIKRAKVYEELLTSELEVCQRSEHFHIVKTFQILEGPKNYWVVMEFLPGGNLLEKFCLSDADFSEGLIVKIVR
jgi:serine/threonine protein kinase